MIRDICKDELFLSQKSEPATPDDPSVAQDSLWQHSTSAWLTSAGALVGIGLVCVGLTAIKLFRQTSKT